MLAAGLLPIVWLRCPQPPQPSILQEEKSPMLKYYVKARETLMRLRTDKDGVVSLEYVIVAACIVTVVIFVFNGTGTNSLNTVLQNGFGQIATQIGTL
jgi:Flp pilus assembly pilin Flp